MAIKLPSIGEQLAPSMDGIKSLIAGIANPDYRQQMALREALLSGRISYDDLARMSDQDVERQFGRGTAKLKPRDRQPTMKDMVDKYGVEEVMRRWALPDGDPEKEEFRAGLGPGFLRPNQRKIEGQNVKQGEQAITQGDQAIIHGNQRTTLGEQAISEGQRKLQEDERKAAARITVNQWRLKNQNPDNIYLAKVEGKMPGNVLAAVMEHEDTKNEYLSQQRDYWSKIEDEYRNKALNERIDPAKAIQEHNIINARKIADQSNQSNVEDILLVLKDRTLEKQYSGTEAPTTPAQKRIWDAVKAVEMSRKMESDDRKRNALEYFRKQVAPISAIFRDERRMKQLGDAGIQAQVDLFNQQAQQWLRAYFEDKDIPQIAFDEKGPRSKDAGMFFFDKKTLYQTQGAPAFGDDALDQTNRPDPLNSYRGKSKKEIDDYLTKLDPSTAATVKQQLMKAGIYKDSISVKPSTPAPARRGREIY